MHSFSRSTAVITALIATLTMPLFLLMAARVQHAPTSFSLVNEVRAENACGPSDPFCLKKAATGGGLTPSGEAPSPAVAVGNILSAMLALLGVLFFALVVWAGFKWMTAQGNQETATSAKTTLENAAIGFVLVLVAYALTTYVVNALFWTPSVSINGITPVQPSVTGPLDECRRVYGGTCQDTCASDERSFVTDDCSRVCCVLNLQCPTYGYVCQTLDVNGRCPTGETPTQNDFKCYDPNQACCP